MSVTARFREKIAEKVFDNCVEANPDAKWVVMDWESLPETFKDTYREVAKQILSLEDGSCKLVIVDNEAELPDCVFFAGVDKEAIKTDCPLLQDGFGKVVSSEEPKTK